MTDPLIQARDLALDDEAALDRALRIVKLFYVMYGSDPITARYAEELGEKLIKVRQHARARHQEAERERLEARYAEEQIAQLL
jgi:hypothetical protein